MLRNPTWKVILILFVTAGSILLSLPSFFSLMGINVKIPVVGETTVNLGLDLQGGSHLLLEVDMNQYLSEQQQGLAEDIRQHLRSEKVGTSEITPAGDSVKIVGIDNDSAARVKSVIGNQYPDLDLELNGKTVTAKMSERLLKDKKLGLMEQSIEIIRRRVDETGTKEPIIQRQGDNRILLQVPGLQDPERLKAIVGKTAKMTFHLVDTTATRDSIPPGSMLVEADSRDEYGRAGYIIKRRVMLSGDSLVDAHATYDRGAPVVNFRFDSVGARKFADITRENVGQPFAIMLDNKVISAPVIREPILGGSGVISGNFTVESANDLALLLRAGALPAPLKVVEERTVGPSLGQDSIQAGKMASLLSLVMVMVFMVVYYSLFGFFADICLMLNLVIIIAMVAAIGATLTLPGIAGMVLSLGIGVDANVLIFERIKEELRTGRSNFSAVEAGYKRAFITIFDSHVTTLVASAILYGLGSGAVKGFAVTLAFGIASSLFTAFMVNRVIVYHWVAKHKPKVIPV